MIDIDKLEAAAKAATQGEWISSGFAINSKALGYCPIADAELDNDRMVENATFIAAANPQAVLELITRLREAEKDAARYKFIKRCTTEMKRSRPEDGVYKDITLTIDATSTLCKKWWVDLDPVIDAPMKESEK